MSATPTPPPPVLHLIIEISKLDVQIAGLQAQLKGIDNERVARTQAITALELKRSARVKVATEKKSLSSREEKGIKFERERINDRRRALGTLNNYKLQQAAEKEIDYVSKQIGQREELLLGLLREIDALDKDIQEVESAMKGLKDELAAFEQASSEMVTGVQARLQELQAERANQAQAVGNNQSLTLYARIAAKFPSNPVVDIVNRENCAGCHMKLGPQVVVQISRGDVVKCIGCGRILKLPAE
jgi:predicted  nucleic acid-binding Zn-ribbon protein